MLKVKPLSDADGALWIAQDRQPRALAACLCRGKLQVKEYKYWDIFEQLTDQFWVGRVRWAAVECAGWVLLLRSDRAETFARLDDEHPVLCLSRNLQEYIHVLKTYQQESNRPCTRIVRNWNLERSCKELLYQFFLYRYWHNSFKCRIFEVTFYWRVMRLTWLARSWWLVAAAFGKESNTGFLLECLKQMQTLCFSVVSSVESVQKRRRKLVGI